MRFFGVLGSPAAFLRRECPIRIYLALELGEEGRSGLRRSLARIVRGVQAVRANAPPPAHLGGVELEGNGDKVSWWRRHRTGAPSRLDPLCSPSWRNCGLPSVGAPIAISLRPATVEVVRPL
jgi:hypothetical protein